MDQSPEAMLANPPNAEKTKAWPGGWYEADRRCAP
jgi:hypothetical protein